MLDLATLLVLHERALFLELLERVQQEHPLVSPYVLEHLYAAAVRDYIDTPDGGHA